MNRLRTLVLVIVALGLAACDKKDEYTLPRTGAGEAEAKSPAVTTNVGDLEREQFLSKAQQKVAELNSRIEALKKQTQLATDELQPKILALGQEMKSLQTKLTEIEATTTDQWKTIKTDIESAIEHLRDTVDKAGG